MYCIDASVMVNSFIEGEKFHEFSKRLMEKIRMDERMVVVPEIVLPEVASAVSRGTNNPKISLRFVTELREVPNFTFIPIDAELSNLACKFAAENKLRGCDAIYVAVSYMFNSKLITLDDKQRERASNVIETLTPMEELEL